ncbi:MAG: outer membrane protein assembly factor BamA [Acidobacteriota bacterium]|nr:outer membrane protein assembly factor BamA [Acidobacteriota bacterium]
MRSFVFSRHAPPHSGAVATCAGWVVTVLAAGLVGLVPTAVAAGPEAMSVGEQAQSQTPLPPIDSPMVFEGIQLAFPTQGNVATVDGQTYLYYMEIDDYVSLPSQGRWTPFDETIEQVLLGDFERLWNTGFLADLSIELIDVPYSNGVQAKRAVFLMEERERVRIVTFDGSEVYDRAEIDTAMESIGLELRLDSRISPRVIRRTEGLLREMWAEKGYQFAEVSHEITLLPGGPKIVELTFHIDEGPKVQVADISFVGNDNISDGSLKSQMRNTRERWLFSFVGGRGTYRPLGFDQDADTLVAHYRNNGYIDAQVGQPELEYLDVSEDGDTRPVRLRIPISEGERYRLGELSFEGQDVIRTESLGDIFAGLEPGEYYSHEVVTSGFEVAREAYGGIGYYEMTAFPDLRSRLETQPEGLPTRIDGDPVVDVTIRLQEGEQYFVNRITFVGNNTTHDEVIRREISLIERGIFNTEALRFSVRRLNQLGYFEPLDEDTAIQIEKRPGFENEVDLVLNVEEANLNQLTFGAGASQFDGFFLQLAFQTTNFLGRGESLTLSLQNGERIKNYNLGFTEPYLFGRPITGGFNLFRRDIRFINQFTQASVGATTTMGFRVGQWSQLFMGYSFEQTDVRELNPVFLNPQLLRFNPFLQDTLLLGQGGARTISKVTPAFVLNTVDHPIFPMSGKRYSLGFEVAGLGGNTQFYKPSIEGVWFLRHGQRLTLGIRARGEYIAPLGDTQNLPIFELLTMGGEFSLRGFDIRSIGPNDPLVLNPDGTIQSGSGLVIGGNKSLLFNAEYIFAIANPVRLLFFYDTGQVADFNQQFSPDLFRTSTGVELRFFMPVLNVPFRLIYAWNPNVEGVLNDRFQPQESTVFKFAVGTTF